MEFGHEHDDVALRTSLRDLAGLVTEGRTMAEILVSIASFAAAAVPNADGAGVSLLRPGSDQLETAAATHAFVTEVDELQYVAVAEGPCLTATAEGHTVRSGSLDDDARWPRFGPRAGRLGVHSALSLPLTASGRTVGSINMYAKGEDAFGDRAAELGELFASPAAVAVHNAQVLVRAFELTERLQATLADRPVIYQAIGLIRGRTGMPTEDAMRHLRELSRDEGRPLIDVARSLVGDAVCDARRRRSQEN